MTVLHVIFKREKEMGTRRMTIQGAVPNFKN